MMSMAISLQDLEDWLGFLEGAVQMVPEARGVDAFFQPWCGLEVLEKDVDSHLHIAQVFRLFHLISAFKWQFRPQRISARLELRCLSYCIVRDRT